MQQKQMAPYLCRRDKEAQRKWIQNSQPLIYAAEIANLRSNWSIRLTLVKQLRLFFDADGFIRCGGRIHNAYFSPDVKKNTLKDEGLTLETSASESLYCGQFTLSTQLINPNYL